MADQYKRAIAWCRREWRRRSIEYDHHPSFLADEIMCEAEVRFALDSAGVEGWSRDNGRSSVSYLNRGETYAVTILVYTTIHGVRWTIRSWGDVVEAGGGPDEE